MGGCEITQVDTFAALAANLLAERLRACLPEIDVDPDEPSSRHMTGDLLGGDPAPAAVTEIEPFNVDAG